jgi:protein AIR1/2
MEDELADSGTDARIDVDGNAMISFIRGEELGSPEVGPSRLSPTTRSSSVDPFNFFPARSDPPVITQSHSNATTFNVAKDSSTIPSDLGTPNVGSPSASRAASTSPIPDIAPAVAEHFDPPPLFSKSLHTALDTRPNSSTGAKLTTGLLLPGNVTVEGDENDESDGRPAPVEGVHFVDDSSQRGVQRYFVEKQTEEEAFLASANSSKICQNCHRPGHRAQDCPHVIVSDGA